MGHGIPPAIDLHRDSVSRGSSMLPVDEDDITLLGDDPSTFVTGPPTQYWMVVITLDADLLTWRSRFGPWEPLLIGHSGTPRGRPVTG